MKIKKSLFGILSATCIAQGVWAAEAIDFEKDVHPILAERCFKCHAGDEHKGGLSMSTREALLEGGEYGPAVIPKDAENSTLIEMITSTDPEDQMPPKGDRLSEVEIDILKAWINADLPWEMTKASDLFWVAPLHPREVDVPRAPIFRGSKHPIDRLLKSYAKQHDVDLPKLVDDERYIRRVYFDLLGMLAPTEAVEAFVADTAKDKRAALVDAVLADNRSYAEHWMTLWNDSLRNDHRGTGYIDGGRKKITDWLYKSLYENKPYDDFTTELIAPKAESEGFVKGIKWRGAQTANQAIPLQAARSVSQVFLGVNMKCASCHDSFTNEWKLVDSYGLANAFSEAPMEISRCDVATGDMAQTKFLWPELGAIDSEAPLEKRREQVAALVTHPENGRYTRTIVNRLWTQLMGRGLVAAPDELGDEPWSADLLDWLAVELVNQDYDLKAMLKLIATSEAYQLNSDARLQVPEEYTFRGPMPRRLLPEQIYDAMACVTGAWQTASEFEVPANSEDAESLSEGTVRSWRIHADPFMRILGRPNRNQIMLAREADFTRLQALEITNGDTLAAYLIAGATKMLESGAVDTQAVMRHAWGRSFPDAEAAILSTYGASIQEPGDLEDVLWLIFNHPEFQIVF